MYARFRFFSSLPAFFIRDLPTDMPAHVKSSLFGASLNIPITQGAFNLGTWQGVWLCEHRDTGGYGGGHRRKIVITLQGLRKDSDSGGDGADQKGQ